MRWQNISAASALLAVSLRRLLRSRQTLICALILGLASLGVTSWSLRHERTVEEFMEHVFLSVFISFLLPIFCLSYASVGISTDREEGTLVYLLSSPLPRPWICLTKGIAGLLLAWGWTLGGSACLSCLAGVSGRAAWQVVWPAMIWSTAAYVGLFSLFGVLFRRATIVALGYALFLETLIGNMPGIAKRLAISFYTRCMIVGAAQEKGWQLWENADADMFVPIAASWAEAVLQIGSLVFLLAAVVVFSTREYSR